MTLADHAAVLALWRTAEGVGLSVSDERPAIRDYLARNPRMSFVAIGEGRIIGAVLAGHDARRGCLHHLAVARAWRRRGVGRALVDAALGRLRASGVLKCNLFLFDHNTAGRTVWQRLGWTARPDLVVMQKALV